MYVFYVLFCVRLIRLYELTILTLPGIYTADVLCLFFSEKNLVIWSEVFYLNHVFKNKIF